MRKRCILALFVAACWLSLANSVVGETRIEVDENGDEYELKRFFIQGRQLSGSGSKSQCVVTRRKRASGSLSVSSQKLSINGLPAVVAEHREAAFVLPGQENIASTKRRYVALAAVQGLLNADNEEDDEEEFEQNAAHAEEQHAVVQALQQAEQQAQKKPVLATYTVPLAQAQPVSTSHLSEGISVVASGATHANVVGNAGIVLVESEQPPKVNPNTHAVFELKPLNQKQKRKQQLKPQLQSLPQPQPQPQADFGYWSEDYEDEEDNAGEDGDFDENGDEFGGDVDEYFYYGEPDAGLDFYEEQAHFITEHSPVISSAIWSSDGEEDDADADADLNKQRKKKPASRRKPAKKSKNKRKQQSVSHKKRRPEQELEQDQDMDLMPAMEQQIKRRKQQQSSSAASSAAVADDRPKPAKKPVASAASGSAPAKKKKQRRRPKPDQVQQQKKRKNRPSSASNKRRRRPSNSSSSSSSSSSALSPLGGYNRRRLTQQELQQKRRRLQQKRRRQEQQRRRRIRNKNRNQNVNDQYFGTEPIINCIYINKDPAPTPTTTTQRSVWNLLGRDAKAEEPVTPNSLAEANADAPDESQAESQSQQASLQSQGIRRSGDFGHRKRTTLRFVGSQQ